MSKIIHQRVACLIEKSNGMFGYVQKIVSDDLLNRFTVGERINSLKLVDYAEGDLLQVVFSCASKHRDIVSIRKLEVSTSVSKGLESSYEMEKRIAEDKLMDATKTPSGVVLEKRKRGRPSKRSMLGVDSKVVKFQDDKEVKQALVNAISAKVEKESPKTGYFHIEPEHAEVYFLADLMLKQDPNKPKRIMNIGPSGYGKTTISEHIAKETGRKFFRMNCGAIRDVQEWFGQKVARDGSTYFQKSAFITIVEEGNAVIVLDEINRLPSFLANSVFPLLDDSAGTYVEDQYFKVGPNVLFVGTMNLGYKYSGTFELDRALSNRFDMFCQVKALPLSVEMKVIQSAFPKVSVEDSELIVKCATKFREGNLDIEFSTRTSLQLANIVSAGCSVRTAIQHCVITRCPADEGINLRKQALDIVNSICGPYKPNPKAKI